MNVLLNPCSCPAVDTNWEIDNGDACSIIADCDLGTGMLNFTGAGTTICNATINISGMTAPGSGGTLQIDSSCVINVASS